MPQLSNEEREKLKRARPTSLAAAARISGITPTSLIVLLYRVKKRESMRAATAAAAVAMAGDVAAVATEAQA